MAITVAGNLEPKYASSYRTEVIETPGKRTGDFDLYTKWRSKMFIELGGRHASGLRRPIEQFPEQIRFTKGKKVFDFNGYTEGGITVSKRLKDAIEDMEPGVHQFVPVELFYKDGSPYPEPLWYFNACTEIDTISPDLGGVRQDTVGGPQGYVWTIRSLGDDKLAVRKDAVAGRAAWADRHYYNATFFSDALVERMKAEKMEGWTALNYWHEV